MQSCWFAHYTSSIFDILIAVALLDLKVPINLIKDYRGEGPSLKKRGLITSLPEKEALLCHTVGDLLILREPVNSKTAHLPPGIPQAFHWSFSL